MAKKPTERARYKDKPNSSSDGDGSPLTDPNAGFNNALREFGFVQTIGGVMTWSGTIPDQRVQPLLERLREGGVPSEQDLEGAPILDRWAPAVTWGHLVLLGAVTGHPKLGNSDLITTSLLIAIDGEGRWARTLSRWYRLGRLGLGDAEMQS